MRPPTGAKLEVWPDDHERPWRGSSLHLVVGEEDRVLDETLLEASGLELSICWEAVHDAWPELWSSGQRSSDFGVVPPECPPENP